MDQKTYTIVEIRTPKTASVNTPMVKTVKLDGNLFLVP